MIFFFLRKTRYDIKSLVVQFFITSYFDIIFNVSPTNDYNMAQVVIIQSFFFKQNLSLMILEVYLITKNYCLRIVVLFL